MAQVGEPDEGAAGVNEISFVPAGEAEADRLLSIVRDGKTLYLEVPKNEAGARLKNMPVGSVSQPCLQGARSGGVGKNSDMRKLFQSVEARGVVVVLVGQEDRVDPLQRLAGGSQHLPEAASGETGIDEHARVFGDEDGGVTGTAAAEDTEAHRHSRLWLNAPPSACASGFPSAAFISSLSARVIVLAFSIAPEAAITPALGTIFTSTAAR